MPKRLSRPIADGTAETVTIVWNPLTGRYLARCSRCADTATADRYGWLATWAENHTCDAELVALLAVLDQRAA